MIAIISKTILFYGRCLFSYWLGIKGKDRRYFLCGYDLVHMRPDYFPDHSRKDPLIGLRYLRYILIWIFTRREDPAIVLSDAPNVIYDSLKSNVELRKDYVENMSGEKIGIFLERSHLIDGEGAWRKMVLAGLLCFITLLVLPFTLFSKKRISYAVIPQVILLGINFQLKFRNTAHRKIYFFNMGYTDANAMAFLLMKNGYYIIKIPSLSALMFRGKCIIADELCLNTRYQWEESKFLKNRLFVGKINQWLPEKFMAVKALHKTVQQSKSPIYDLGFYSSGYYLRIQRGDMDPGEGGRESYIYLMECLKKYFQKNTKKNLAIFLHPQEKNSKLNYENSKEMFMNYFKGCNVNVMPREVETLADLGIVNVAIAVSSSTLAERLVLGYKVLFAPFYISGYPIEESSLRNVSAKTEKEFEDKMDQMLSQTREEYFEVFNLQEYRFNNRPELFLE